MALKGKGLYHHYRNISIIVKGRPFACLLASAEAFGLPRLWLVKAGEARPDRQGSPLARGMEPRASTASDTTGKPVVSCAVNHSIELEKISGKFLFLKRHLNLRNEFFGANGLF